MESPWADLFYPRGIPPEHSYAVDQVRDAFATLASKLQNLLPNGRYKAIVKTELEKVAALSTKAFTHEGV